MTDCSSEPSLDRMLTFILARAEEDEEREHRSDSPDEGVLDACALARIMVTRTRRPDSPEATDSWLTSLRQVALLHPRHPHYQQEWTPRHF